MGTSSAAGFMDNLRQLFAECDLDGSGSLGPDEFRELCTKIGLSPDLANETFKRLDTDKNSQITFDEFAAGFNQYTKQAAATVAATPPSTSPAPGGSGRDLHGTKPTAGRQPPQTQTQAQARHQQQQQQQQSTTQKLAPSPVSARARSRASPSGGASVSLGSTGGGSSSSGNLTASGRSTSSGGTQLDLSSSCELQSSCELPNLQQSASAHDLLTGSNSISSNNNNNNVVVYSSEHMIGNQDYSDRTGGSGQFGSMLSSSSSFSQAKTMQDLLECVQKLQNENQILTQIFFKDKREREEYIHQLGEEFDQQLREVEERANRRAREELESEKKRLSEMMQTERETLQHHYQTLEKISKMVKSPKMQAGQMDDVDGGLYKVKTQLEDTFNENRQLKKSLMATKTDVAMIWKEMEKLKKQYEVKLSSAYEKQRETQHECDHIKKQLNLMKDSNRKLQDASDVITNYINDKVEPVIKVALDGGGGDDDSSSSPANGNSLRLPAASSDSSSRRGSILSEYLLNDGDSNNYEDDSESMASSLAEQKQRQHPLSNHRHAPGLRAKVPANGVLTEESPQNDQSTVASGKQMLQANSDNNSSRPAPEKQRVRDNKQQTETTAQQKDSVAAAKSSLKNFGRHFLLGAKTHSSDSGAKVGADLGDGEKATATRNKSLDQICEQQTAQEDPIIEPADGPSKATFNIILVGDSFVGKSSFAARFIEGTFVQGLISNCSIDFKTKSYKVDSVNYTVNLWDTAGQERFRSITASYFRKADGIILMYDVTDKRSYLNVRNWMSTIADTAAENVAVLLVGNKIDLRKHDNKAKCVPTEEGFRLAREYDIVFLETSVKTGTNLLPSMGKLIRLIAKNNRAEEEDTDRIRLSDKNRTFNCMPKNC